MKALIQNTIGSIRRFLSEPLGELNRWQRTARYAVGIARYGAYELKEDRASQMAAALTYRTIFSMVPLFVMSVLVFEAFGGFQSVGGELQEKIYDYLGLDAIELRQVEEQSEQQSETSQPAEEPSPEAEPLGVNAESQNSADLEGGNDADPNTPDEEQTKARVDQLLADLQAQVASVDFKSIGLIGLGLLIWAGLSLVVSLETSFNRIYHAPAGRAWHLRITIYWAVITLGPVLVALSFFLTSQLLSTASSLDAFGLLGWTLNLLAPLTSTAATWLLLLLIYKLLPNAKVQLRAAVIGAFVAAVLWEVSKWGFRIYMNKAVGYSALYGSLGLVPLFLLWMYVTWMVILFGLEISYVVQTVKDTRFFRPSQNDQDADRLVETTAVLRVARAVAQGFNQGQAVSLEQLHQDTELPQRIVQRLAAALESAGHLHRQESDDEDADATYALSRPADQIALADLLKTGRTLSTSPNQDSDNDVIHHVHQAANDAVADQTLQDLVDADDEPNTGDNA